MNRLSLSGIFVSAALALALPVVAHASGRPSISVGAPASGSIIHGTSLTVHFLVQNFKLVPIGGQAPKNGTGSAGHIQTRLDTYPINPATDLTASEIHTWQDIPAGHHVLTIWLANTMNVPIPGVAPATLAFTILPAPSVYQRPLHQSTSPGVGAAPRTGGADGATTPELNHNLLFTALLALFLGVMVFSMQRLLFGIAGRRLPSGGSVVPADPSTAQNGTIPHTSALLSSVPTSDAPAAPTVSPDSAMSYDVISGPSDTGFELQAGPTIDAELGPIAARTQPALPTTASSPGSAAPPDDHSLAEAVEASRRWPEMVQELAQRIEQGTEERRRQQEQIVALEQVARDAQKLRISLCPAGANPVNADDLNAVRYVADELVRDPDHIVTLAAVSQHATRVRQVVEEYARLHTLLYGEGNR